MGSGVERGAHPTAVIPVSTYRWWVVGGAQPTATAVIPISTYRWQVVGGAHPTAKTTAVDY